MSLLITERISVPRGNQRIFRVGPIPTGSYNLDGSPIWYNPAGHTAFLYIKSDRHANDLTAIVIQGNIFGEITNGWFVDFIVSASDVSIAGIRWMRVDLIPPLGQPTTLVKQEIFVESV